MRHLRTLSAGLLFPSLAASLLAMGAGCQNNAGVNNPGLSEVEQKVVYGDDDRRDVYDHPDMLLRQRAERSTVALVDRNSIDDSNPSDVKLIGKTLGETYSLCTTERFLNDPTPAFCSGTLIADDLVLTAGHCITNQAECSAARFVFKFYRPGQDQLQTLTTDDIFACKEIVARKLTNADPVLDFGIIRLDRSAAPRFEPAPVHTGDTTMEAGASVTVIGTGSGIPFKIDSGGHVRDNRSSQRDYFFATTDTFGGNSGSGVYDNASGDVVGILVRGDRDYVNQAGCYVANVCPETGCRGEGVTYVRRAIDGLCEAEADHALCKATDGVDVGGNGGTTKPVPAGGSFTFEATETLSAAQGTVNHKLTVSAGQRVTIGTCGVDGGSVEGDSYLRLFDANNTQVSHNDDSCGGRGSRLVFTAATGGEFEIRAGCYSNQSCSGTVAWTFE